MSEIVRLPARKFGMVSSAETSDAFSEVSVIVAYRNLLPIDSSAVRFDRMFAAVSSTSTSPTTLSLANAEAMAARAAAPSVTFTAPAVVMLSIAP